MEIINIAFPIDKHKKIIDEIADKFSKYAKGFIFEPCAGVGEELTDEDREERYQALQDENERMMRDLLRRSIESIRVIMG